MSRVVNKAENWERAYEAFQQVNFSAWDFQTVKESLVDYLKLYYPEDFNDFIESSELIALLELFAYIAELMAYRFDLNAHENFLSTAERKESVLRLAKLLSYNPSRNIPARGLVKLTSISTTERVFDSSNNDLSNVTIRWNDPNNVNWKEQFILVMNRVLDQNFGTVLPGDRVQVQDVVFERYKIINNPLATNVLPYSITVSNETLPMELVSSDLNEFGPLETRPEKDLQLGILYLNDGLGDSSENTGFFMFTKQGEIQRTEAFFDGVTPNQTYDVEIDDSNETDIFVNNIDEVTDEVITDSTDLNADTRAGEWVEVDTAGGQNVIFNNDTNRNKYEVETLDNDQFRLIFGDGKFANIPSGKFEIWSRTSANTDTPIPTAAIQNVASSFTYQDPENKEQTFNVTVSLLTPIQNAAPSEDIEDIRRTAPAVYFTQDRMVNNRDYNEFMLQDNTILKLRAINRTFAGDSKYIFWHDPRENYENVKIFGDDGVMYFNSREGSEEICETINGSDLPAEDPPNHEDLVDALVDNHIEPLLSSSAFFTRFILEGLAPAAIRTEFSTTERADLEADLVAAIGAAPATVYGHYDSGTDTWTFDNIATDYWFSIAYDGTDWELCYTSLRLVFHSDETKFWNTNDDDAVITTDTLQTNLDTIVVVKANIGTPAASPTILTQNYNYDVLGQFVITDGENSGLPSIHDLYVVPEDTDGDGFPDNPDLSYLIGGTDYVYFNRENTNAPWIFQTTDQDIDPAAEWAQDQIDNPAQADQLWKRENGVEQLNFAWFHRTPRYHLIDPAASNLIDMYLITRGYARNIRLWLNGQLAERPEAPTPFQLRSDYQDLLENKMISDTVILHTGAIKVILGSKADPELRGTIKVIRSADRSLSNTQIKTTIVNVVRDFFDITKWEFGETFYFSELAATIHAELPAALDSVVLVPTLNTNEFGDLYQVLSREDEILQADFGVNQVEIVESLDATTLQQ
jgi:hypothetical protein